MKSKKLSSLTPDQTKLIPIVRDEFLKIGLSTEPTDFVAAEAAVKEAYEVAGLDPPKFFIRLSSPLQGAFAAAMLSDKQMGNQIEVQARVQVWEHVQNLIRVQVGHQVRDQIDQIWTTIENQAADVSDQIQDQVDQIQYKSLDEKMILNQIHKAFYSQHEAGWLSFYSFFSRIGIESADRLSALIKVSQSCGWVWFFENVAIITDRPTTLNRDEMNRLHCETGPAILYQDGFSIYSWHGTRVPSHWIEDRENLDPAEVLGVENVEQRVAGCAIIGWAKISEKLNRKIIDGDPDTDLGALVELTLPGLSEPGRFLMAKCPRNGIICEGVPLISDIDRLPINTVIAAQAWRIGDPVSEYIHPPKRT